ncbi:Swt1 family HEPN domain-containing protein [Enterobacter cloacae]|uniref:Swt1 family HEPN domain-containing protein n=2 Tax=Enterobacteriaceae TaxID=543 RepID=UPI002A836963|nr:Swt1 family HEPN domain-containing protein [Enterobacter cloacae]
MEDKIKVFAFSNKIAERELDRIENELKLDLGRGNEKNSDIDDDYYPQFSHVVRVKAKEMSKHYEIFYCLEVSIRSLIKEKLNSELGNDWWEGTNIPEHIKKNVRDNMQREIDSAFTPRSDDELDYTTFGELGEIVRKNWTHFADLFNSEKAFNRVMNSLNLLRGPIAHCSPLAEDEVVRLKLTLKDWFRLME